ncbi:MAG: helix-turn-helix domain-containing protein [Prochloraceae cyanobacterium]
MEEQQRKDKFVELLMQLLDKSGGVKMKLAQKLGIKPSTLTPWLQGKIDPASLDVIVFNRLAELLNLSVDEVAISLAVVKDKTKTPLQDKFRSLIEELLSVRSQQELAQSLDLSQNAISRWINPQISINPRNLNIATIAAIAIEKKWTIERLLIYLGLKEKKIQENLLSRIKLDISSLSVIERAELLNWFNNIYDLKKIINIEQYIPSSNKTICTILEQEDIKVVSKYSCNFVVYFQTQPNNLEFTTISKTPALLEDFNLLIFDVDTNASAAIELINKISFNGDIVIFTSPELEQEVRQQLKDKVTDIVVKPIDWLELKNKSYFM